MPTLEEIERKAIAARTFEHKRGPATFQFCAVPLGEWAQRMRNVQDAEQDEAALSLLLDSLTGWRDLPAGWFDMTDDASPVDYSRDACLRLFKERPDVMGELGEAVRAFIYARAAKIESERKNFESTSSPN